MTPLINLLILISISFSIAHGVIIDTHQDNHCSINEFVVEFSEPLTHDIEEHNGDLCNTHFMLHISFILPINFLLEAIKIDKDRVEINPFTYSYIYLDNTFRPPII